MMMMMMMSDQCYTCYIYVSCKLDLGAPFLTVWKFLVAKVITEPESISSQYFFTN